MASTRPSDMLPPAKPNFASLLENTKQLRAQLESQGYTQLQRTPDQVDERSRQLAARSARTVDSVQAVSKATKLMANRGVDLERAGRLAKEIRSTKEVVRAEMPQELDIEGLLRWEHENIIINSIEEVKLDTLKKFEESYLKGMNDDWEVSKRELMEELGFGSGATSQKLFSSMPRSAPERSNSAGQFNGMLSSGASTPQRRPLSQMDTRMREYAKVITAYNDALQKSGRLSFDLIGELTAASRRIEDPESRKIEITETWNLLRCVIQESSDDGRKDVSPDFTDAYIGRASRKAESDITLRRRLVRGTRKFLELQYLQFMQNFNTANPQAARLGGRPSHWNDVHSAPVAGLEIQRTTVNGVHESFPQWAALYYLLRSGAPKPVVESFLTPAHRPAHGSADQAVYFVADGAASFVAGMRDYLQFGRLSKPNLDEVTAEWTRVRATSDPFKQLLYNLLIRYDMNKPFPTIITTAQDFLWLRLCFVREAESGGDGSVLIASEFTLKTLQQLLYHTYGATHFNKKGRYPLLYFQVLLMSQQFERAIYYLISSTDAYVTEAVHFAAALHLTGLLCPLPADRAASDALFLDTPPSDRPCLSFTRLLRKFIRLFAEADPLEALQYHTLITDDSERMVAVRDFVLESRDFEALVGSLKPDGSRKPGFISKILTRDQAAQVIEAAANASESSGRYEDAVMLYDLSERYEKALRLLSTQLAKVLVRGDDRERLRQTAATLLARYKRADTFDSTTTIMSRMPARERRTFELLEQLATFFDMFQQGKRQQALEQIETMRLFHGDQPNSPSATLVPFDLAAINASVIAFRELDEKIRDNFADVLLATMTLLYQEYEQEKEKIRNIRNFNPQAAEQIRRDAQRAMEELQRKAKALITFFGMVQFRMPLDTHSRLIKMQVWMNS